MHALTSMDKVKQNFVRTTRFSKTLFVYFVDYQVMHSKVMFLNKEMKQHLIRNCSVYLSHT